MLAVNHAMTGAAGWLAVGPLLAPTLGTTEMAAATVVAAGASLAPDLDHPGSTVSRSLGVVSQTAAAGVGLVSGGHRMLTHSLLFVAAVWVAATWTIATWGASAAALLAAVPVAIGLPLLARRMPFFLSTPAAFLLAVGLWWTINAGHLDHSWVVAAVTVGVLLHTIPGDLLTPSGVPLLAPFSRRRFAIPLFRTGSPIETIVGVAITVAAVLLAVRAFG